MAHVAAYKVGKALCNVLKLNPQKTKSINIAIEAGGIALVTVVQYVDEEDIQGIAAIMDETQAELAVHTTKENMPTNVDVAVMDEATFWKMK